MKLLLFLGLASTVLLPPAACLGPEPRRSSGLECSPSIIVRLCATVPLQRLSRSGSRHAYSVRLDFSVTMAEAGLPGGAPDPCGLVGCGMPRSLQSPSVGALVSGEALPYLKPQPISADGVTEDGWRQPATLRFVRLCETCQPIRRLRTWKLRSVSRSGDGPEPRRKKRSSRAPVSLIKDS